MKTLDKGTPIGLDETPSVVNTMDKGTPIGVKADNTEGDASDEDQDAESPKADQES
ncbi:MAG: hypothetical protein NVSMB24_33760 [Mucilaginibacter sp.]